MKWVLFWASVALILWAIFWDHSRAMETCQERMSYDTCVVVLR